MKKIRHISGARSRPPSTSPSKTKDFAEAVKQIKYSVIAVVAVAIAEIISNNISDSRKYEHQKKSEQIEREEKLISDILVDFNNFQDELVHMSRGIPHKDVESALNDAKLLLKIPDRRRNFISLYVRVASVLGTQNADSIINLDPKFDLVDHSEREDCHPEYLQNMLKNPSMYFYYYVATCTAVTAAGADITFVATKDGESSQKRSEIQKRNLDVVLNNIENFERYYTSIEYQLLKHLEKIKRE